MTTINDLSVASSVSSDDKIPLWQNANGVTRALPVSVLDGRYLTQDDIAELAADAKVETFISSTLPNPDGLPTFVAGTTLALTLANQYYSVNNLEVFFDGTFQGPDQYSLVGYGLTFISPIPLGVQNVYIRGGAARIIGAPSDGTVTTSSLVDGAVTEAKIADSSVSDQKIKWGPALRRNFTSISQLRAINNSDYRSAFVTGYYTSFDGGGGPYDVDTTDTISLDNGGSIIVDSIGQRWKLNGAPDWYVEQFGAKGDGVSDDAAAINAAISALPNRGGTVRLRGKTYAVGSTIFIGNGNGLSVPSTKNGIKFIGMGGGFGQYSNPTILQPVDTGATTPYLDSLLRVNGPVEGLQIEGFKIYCAGANSSAAGSLVRTAFWLNGGVTGSVFRQINMVHFSTVGLYVLAGGAPTGNYNIFNEFHQISSVSNVNGHIGLLMDGVYAVSNDTWISSFYNCRFDTFTAINATAGYFKFVDSCSFHRCHFVGNNTGGVGLSGCCGAYFNAVGNNGFPCGMNFQFCSILSTFVNETTDKIRAITFEGYGTLDNETIPTHPKLIGYTDQGVRFNGWGA